MQFAARWVLWLYDNNWNTIASKLVNGCAILHRPFLCLALLKNGRKKGKRKKFYFPTARFGLQPGSCRLEQVARSAYIQAIEKPDIPRARKYTLFIKMLKILL